VSVAFRRDSDEEHLEPRFAIPIPPGRNLVTPRGLAMIGARVAEVEAVLPGLSGDEEGRKAAARDLVYWRARLATAEVQPAPDCRTVSFGCRVSYRLGGKDSGITIVGHDEADPPAGKLSFLAPLCRALMGAEVGDLVDFNGRDEAIEVMAITLPS